jgi:hypothetical protein
LHAPADQIKAPVEAATSHHGFSPFAIKPSLVSILRMEDQLAFNSAPILLRAAASGFGTARLLEDYVTPCLPMAARSAFSKTGVHPSPAIILVKVAATTA